MTVRMAMHTPENDKHPDMPTWGPVDEELPIVLETYNGDLSEGSVGIGTDSVS